MIGQSLSQFLYHEATRSTGICTPPWMGCQSITALNPGCREALSVRVKCLVQEHKTMSLLEPRLLYPVSMGPPLSYEHNLSSCEIIVSSYITDVFTSYYVLYFLLMDGDGSTVQGLLNILWMFYRHVLFS